MSPPWFSTAIASGAASSSPWKLPFHPSEMLRGLRLRLPSPGQECEQLSSVFPFARYDDVEEIARQPARGNARPYWHRPRLDFSRATVGWGQISLHL